jgi:hypothetical protein
MRRRHDGQRHDVVVDGLHAAADHDLEAVAGLRDRAEHSRNGFDGGLVDLVSVVELEAQSCGAVVRLAMFPGPPTASTISDAEVDAIFSPLFRYATSCR